MSEPNYMLSVHAQLACLWEATARKPGNVHRFRDFSDTSYLDYATSAAVIAPILGLTPHYGVGAAVCETVRLTQHFCPRNTNLGIALLLVPLARASNHGDYRANVGIVLDSLTVEDANYAYKAIRLARPGGLNRVTEQDISTEPTLDLRACMALAQDRDLIARQYVNAFADVFDFVAPAILVGVERTGSLEGGIIHAFLELMARFPDSLIARKRGIDEAQASSVRAKAVLGAGWPHSEAGRTAIVEFDTWLRTEGNSRNPGTSADLIAAGLFVLLRTFRLKAEQGNWELKQGAP